LCQKDDFFLNSSIWKRFFDLKLFAIPGLKRVQKDMKKLYYFRKMDGWDEKERF